MATPLTTPRQSPTIYDVARRAGVSISTVSLALNSPDRVRAETLARVHAAVNDLGFVPKAEAAVRARKGTRRIGVVAPFTSFGSFLDRLQGVIAAAEDDRYEVVVYNQEATALRHHFVDSMSLSRKLDGIILMSVPISDRLAQRLLGDGLETVLVEFARPEFSSVTIDDDQGGRLAAEHLVRRGHKRCAFLGEIALLENSSDGFRRTQQELRLLGFRTTLADAGIDLPDRHVLASHDLGTARQAMHHLLDLDRPPTAIFAHSDELAAEALKAIRERQLTVPDDVAVIGYDDRSFAEYLGLTTVRQPLVESGQIALNLLQDRLTGQSPTVPQMVKLPVSVVERETA